MSLFGVDVSSVQGVTAPVAVDFAYIRVRRSNGSVDTNWGGHYTALAGKRRAPYIFVRPPSVEAFSTQVSSFLSLCNWHTIAWEWGPVLDCEWTGLAGYSGPAMTAAQVGSLVAELRHQLGDLRAVVYVYLGHQDAGMAATIAVDANVRLIGARYVANNRANAWANFGPAMPNQDVVQYWNAGTVAGIGGLVDLNDARNPLLGGNQGSGVPDVELSDSLAPYGATNTDGSAATVGSALADVFVAISNGAGHVPGNETVWQRFSDLDAAERATQAQLTSSVSMLDVKIDGAVAAVNGETDQDKAALLAAIQAIPAGTLNPAVLSAVQSLLTALSTSTPAAPTA